MLGNPVALEDFQLRFNLQALAKHLAVTQVHASVLFRTLEVAKPDEGQPVGNVVRAIGVWLGSVIELLPLVDCLPCDAEDGSQLHLVLRQAGCRQRHLPRDLHEVGTLVRGQGAAIPHSLRHIGEVGVQNVVRCAERCGLTVADVVLEPLASADAVLSDDEQEIGVAVIDVGGGTTDLLLYVDGGIGHTSVIPVGGNNVTADIAAGLRTPMGEAERLKRNVGCALGRMVADDEEIEVPGVGGHPSRTVARRLLADIIEPRVEEIFAVIRNRIEDTGLLEQLSAGAVLTGGGVLMEGTVEFAEEILGMPVRLGVPIGVKGITQLVAGPQYATGVGLVQYGASALADARGHEERPEPAIELVPESSKRERSGSRLVSWLRAAF